MIENIQAVRFCDLFDDIYEIIMRLLSYVFVHTAQDHEITQKFSHTAIQLMTSVMKPLGEVITLTPAEFKSDLKKYAGPVFRLSRHVTLPPNPSVAIVIARERLSEIQSRLLQCREECVNQSQLKSISNNLGEIVGKF